MTFKLTFAARVQSLNTEKNENTQICGEQFLRTPRPADTGRELGRGSPAARRPRPAPVHEAHSGAAKLGCRQGLQQRSPEKPLRPAVRDEERAELEKKERYNLFSHLAT